MGTSSFQNYTRFLYVLAYAISALALLLLLVRITIIFLRKRVHKRMQSHDLEQIGREALVLKTIRPQRIGQIELEWEDGFWRVEAKSDRIIRNGRKVTILGIKRGIFQVTPVAEKGPEKQA